MKKDDEVKLLLRERKKGISQELAAARAGMSVRTARKYEHSGTLPSEQAHIRAYRTRPDPFIDDWPWVQEQVERDPALQATTLFALLCQLHPGRYQAGQLRTLQRKIVAWRAQQGPEQEVMFEQVHRPGLLAQSDFTHMDSLDITLAGIPFPHLLFHLVLTYSNYEAVTLCFSETFEALAEGIETCLWQIGGVPQDHRTDNLSAAIRPLTKDARKDFTDRYQGLMDHYGMRPTTNTAGVAHQNGDVEQSHYRFKQAVDQALRVRGSRDFADRAAYIHFLHELLHQRNMTRQGRWTEEQAALRPLPATKLAPARELRVHVSRFSTIHVLGNVYSVPSRLIGLQLVARVRAETLDLYHALTLVLILPRLRGRKQHHIDYRHVIWSLVRKPGAFGAYRYREELFPSLLFRRTYDQLQTACPQRADREYLRVLHLAAGTSEAEVEAALTLLLESETTPTFEAVRELVRQPTIPDVPIVTTPVLNLVLYDHLIPSQRDIHEVSV